jgi:hypothetical protein
MHIQLSSNATRPKAPLLPKEDRTARLTILIDPRKKAIFESLCAEEDATPSQVVRRLVRGYIEQRTGRQWSPPGNAPRRKEERLKETSKRNRRREQDRGSAKKRLGAQRDDAER